MPEEVLPQRLLQSAHKPQVRGIKREQNVRLWLEIAGRQMAILSPISNFTAILTTPVRRFSYCKPAGSETVENVTTTTTTSTTTATSQPTPSAV